MPVGIILYEEDIRKGSNTCKFPPVQGNGVSHRALIQTTKNEEELHMWVPALSRLHKCSQNEDNRQRR